MCVRGAGQSLEESINRRQFRPPPNVPLRKSMVDKPEERREALREERQAATTVKIREQRGEFLAKMVNDAVVDTTLADFWNRNLATLYNSTRVFSYDDSTWNMPLLVNHTDDS